MAEHGEAAERQDRRASYAAPAVEKAFDIIELLAGQPARGLTISEMAQQLNRSIGEIFRVVVVMERRGWLAKSAPSDAYTVTNRLLQLSHRATPARELIAVAAPEMEQLARLTAQSCHLVIVAEQRGLVVQREQSPAPGGFALRLGTEVDLSRSCSGSVFTRFDERLRAQVLADAPADHAQRLEPRWAHIDANGFAQSPSARINGVTDISVPVFGFTGAIAAALTIPYLHYIDSSALATFDEAVTLLRAAGRRISEGLGYYEELA